MQLQPGQKVPFIVAPSGQATMEFIYPIPTWEERIYKWDLFKSISGVMISLSVAVVCSIVIGAMLITMIIHRHGTFLFLTSLFLLIIFYNILLFIYSIMILINE